MPARNWSDILEEEELLSMGLSDIAESVSEDSFLLSNTGFTDGRRKLPALYTVLSMLGECSMDAEEYNRWYEAHKPPPPPEHKVDRGNGPGED
jgi:hypothetical protein